MLGGGGPKIKVDQNGMKHGLLLEFLRSDEIFKIGGGGQKIKVAQNGVKHGLVLEFLRSDEIFEIWSEKLTGQQASKQGSIHPDTIVTR